MPVLKKLLKIGNQITVVVVYAGHIFFKLILYNLFFDTSQTCFTFFLFFFCFHHIRFSYFTRNTKSTWYAQDKNKSSISQLTCFLHLSCLLQTQNNRFFAVFKQWLAFWLFWVEKCFSALYGRIKKVLYIILWYFLT